MGGRLTLVGLFVVALLLVLWATARDTDDGPPPSRRAADAPDRPREGPPPIPSSTPDLPPSDAPPRPFTLRVRVLGPAGRPVPDARLTFVHEELLPPVEGRTDAQGAAELRPLGCGSLTVLAPRRTPAHRSGLAAEPGGELDVEIRLDPGLTFRGTVLDHRGNPARAAVRLHPLPGSWLSDTDFSFRSETGADGGFLIERLPPGTYQLDVRPWDRHTGLAPPMIEVQAGGAADVRLLPPRTTTLRIVDAATGELVTGEIRVLVSVGERTSSTLHTNSTGEIILDDVPLEGARVVVVAEGREPAEATIRGSPGIVEEIRVTRRRSATGRVTLALRDAGGDPLADVQVLRVRQMGGNGESVAVNGGRISGAVVVAVPVAEGAPGGRVSLELPEGAHEIQVRPRAGGPAATVVLSVEGGAESLREVDFARLGSVRVVHGAKKRPHLRLLRDGTVVHPDSRQEEGAIVYTGLEPGSVTIEYGVGGVPLTREVMIEPGGEIEVRLDRVR